MAKYLTNGDKILQAVLSDQRLCEYAEYNVADFETISEALDSDNPIVCAIAKIIDGNERNLTEKEIYNEISNYLKQTI
ncbi:MAG: hypothetical protein VB110_01975 [Bacteroidales bacterium]|nr:hypothetical protein [Bacteroidales bacterium]